MSAGRSIRIVLAVLVLAAAPARAGGTQGWPAEIAMDDLLRLLDERSPLAASVRAEADVVAADLVEAEILPNPTVGYGITAALSGADSVGGREHVVSVEIPFLIGGKRSARRQGARLRVAAAEAGVRATMAQAAREAGQLFVALLAAQERVRLLEEALADTEGIAAVIAARVQAGSASVYHARRMRLEVGEVRARLADARAARDDLGGALARLVGAPGWLPRARGPLQPRGIAAGKGAPEPDTLPPVALARRAQEAAMGEVAIARTERWPVPSLSVGGGATTDPHGTMAFVGVSVPLPVFDRGQGMLARATAEARAARRRLEATQAEARAERDRAAHLLAIRQAALVQFEETEPGGLDELRTMAENSYLNGQGGIADLLDALRSITEIALTRIDLIEAVMAAEVDYLAASGRLGPGSRQ